MLFIYLIIYMIYIRLYSWYQDVNLPGTRNNNTFVSTFYISHWLPPCCRLATSRSVSCDSFHFSFINARLPNMSGYLGTALVRESFLHYLMTEIECLLCLIRPMFIYFHDFCNGYYYSITRLLVFIVIASVPRDIVCLSKCIFVHLHCYDWSIRTRTCQ